MLGNLDPISIFYFCCLPLTPPLQGRVPPLYCWVWLNVHAPYITCWYSGRGGTHYFCQGWEFYLPTRPPLTPGEWGCPHYHRRGADSPHSPQNCFNTILEGKGSSAWWVWKSRLPPLVPIDTTQWGLITAWQGSKPISVFSLVWHHPGGNLRNFLTAWQR